MMYRDGSVKSICWNCMFQKRINQSIIIIATWGPVIHASVDVGIFGIDIELITAEHFCMGRQSDILAALLHHSSCKYSSA